MISQLEKQYRASVLILWESHPEKKFCYNDKEVGMQTVVHMDNLTYRPEVYTWSPARYVQRKTL